MISYKAVRNWRSYLSTGCKSHADLHSVFIYMHRYRLQNKLVPFYIYLKLGIVDNVRCQLQANYRILKDMMVQAGYDVLFIPHKLWETVGPGYRHNSLYPANFARNCGKDKKQNEKFTREGVYPLKG